MSTRRAVPREAPTRKPSPAVHPTSPLTHTTGVAGTLRPHLKPGGPLRLLAARLIQEQLLRIGRAAQAADRELGAALRCCVAQRLHRALGYRRLADYLADRPGLSLGSCRRLIRRDRVSAGSSHLEEPLFEPPPEPYSPNGPVTDGSGGTVAEFDVWMDVTRTVREALRPLGPGAGPGDPAHGSPFPEPPLTGGDPDPLLFDRAAEACQGVEAAVRERVRRAQALAWRRARLLASAARHHLYRDLCFTTLDDWGREVLGLSPACITGFLAMERMLRSRPGIEDAFRRGRLTWSRTVHAARAALPDNERAWIRDARRLPIERLRRIAEAVDVSARGRGCAG